VQLRPRGDPFAVDIEGDAVCHDAPAREDVLDQALLRGVEAARERAQSWKSSLNMTVPASLVISGPGLAYSTVTVTVRVSESSSIFVAEEYRIYRNREPKKTQPF
jgi:hypothetical protein